ncbi:hypothetical protein [Azospirillum picis]|uniref:Uncharacterized protein n=1 Tax=Azospirillum picis TaxID=488438 RepID=A0ABU0MRQ6_9PROT|nr:hypothetical protein [Azospirillum picis]MBP2302589.1 hypothetical protein [Azospirillum picis]MDQ0536169.1 hypothetical protein [Azospirillum picis]
MCGTVGEGRPSPWTVSDLTAAERALLTGIRQWFRAGTAGAMASMRIGLNVAGVPNTALLPLFAVLGTFAVSGVRSPEIRCPACSRISTDEAALLDALAAVQGGDAEVANQVLDRWLPMVALCMASDAMRELAAILDGARIYLPRRRAARLAPMPAALAAE